MKKLFQSAGLVIGMGAFVASCGALASDERGCPPGEVEGSGGCVTCAERAGMLTAALEELEPDALRCEVNEDCTFIEWPGACSGAGGLCPLIVARASYVAIQTQLEGLAREHCDAAVREACSVERSSCSRRANCIRRRCETNFILF